MSHLDESQLAALFDDELNPEQKRAAEAHLAMCAECHALWEETRALATEADRLVATVQLPPRAGPLAWPPQTPASGTVTLAVSRRPLPWRTLAWAASVVLAVGLGYSLRSASRGRTDGYAPEAAADKAMMNQSDKPAAVEPPSPPPIASRPAQPAAGIPAEVAKRPEATPGAAANALRDAAPTPAPAVGALASRDAEANPAAAERSSAEARAARRPGGPADRGLREVDMAVAVRTLAGSIRLVDGLEPVRVLAGPGRLLADGDPTVDAVRVVYLDPPGRELWLDQQRTRSESESPLARRTEGLLPGDTVLAPVSGGAQSVRWMDQHGFRLVLTGFLSGDSLRALIPRVR